jgi:transposase InsO family protein
LSPKEALAMDQYISESLTKGFIRPSHSPVAAPCFFVAKKDGTLRPVQDYRRLNANTVKSHYPLPRINDVLDKIGKGKMWTKIDLRSAYNLIRIRPGDEWKTAFITPKGQFESLVLSFGFANAPSHFQSTVNNIFRDLLETFLASYMDDFFIISETGDLDQHKQDVKTFLHRCRENNLFAKLEKCQYASDSLTFLGFKITANGVAMDPEKTRAISTWPIPGSVKDIQAFLGFCNFYRRFINNYAALTQPLTTLTKKDVTFKWTADEQSAFEAIKSRFQTDVVLQYVDNSKKFILETDASNFALGGVLSQEGPNNELQPIAFFSRQLLDAERNYSVYDKELLAIIMCLKQWRQYLYCASEPFLILTDHKNLEFFKEPHKMTQRQCRWLEFLQDFTFHIEYRPGGDNTQADLLSRRSDYNEGIEQPTSILLPADIFLNNINIEEAIHSPTLNKVIDPAKDWPLLIKDFLITDEWLPGINVTLKEKLLGESQHFIMVNDELHYIKEDKITKIPYCPSWKRQAEVNRYHRGLGHLSYGSIESIIKRRCWWDSMSSDIKIMIATCMECQLAKKLGKPRALPLRPLPSMALPFERWGIDFIQDLPMTKSGNSHIITAIDYATRWIVAKAVPNRDQKTVLKFLYELALNYGPPGEIISDRANVFLSEALREFEGNMGIKHKASTPYHPRTNGMVERMHSMMGHSITTMCEGNRERWDEHLAATIWAIRVRKHAVTKESPFYLLYGIEPRLPFDVLPPREINEPLDPIETFEQLSEWRANTLADLGQTRAAAYTRTEDQRKQMMMRNENADGEEFAFKIGEWVKIRNHTKLKFESNWKGPYHVVDFGFPGSYWLMDSNGRRLDSTTNESDIASWLTNTDDGSEDVTMEESGGEDSVNTSAFGGAFGSNPIEEDHVTWMKPNPSQEYINGYDPLGLQSVNTY